MDFFLPVIDSLKKIRTVLAEAGSSFKRNNDLAMASSLAFSAMLALIPALFLITAIAGMVVGSSQDAFRKVQDMAGQLIPSTSEAILREVRYLASHKRAIGVVNGLVLLFAVMPLVSDIRSSLVRIFHRRPSRPFLLEKLMDLAITAVFLLVIASIAVIGVAWTIAGRDLSLPDLPPYLSGIFPFLFQYATVLLLYVAFARRSPLLHLAAGALVSACLWFVMRPLFHQFLAYNPGFGFAFGSFKSLFVVLLWIYYSLAVFLFGAEIASCLGRKETVFLKRLIDGKGGVPASFAGNYLVRFDSGAVIFREGDVGGEMYAVRQGSVGIQKDGKQIAVIPQGKCFGGMSFLLSARRVATAVALDDTELVSITNENVRNLMNEHPEFVVEALREMAMRLREADRLID